MEELPTEVRGFGKTLALADLMLFASGWSCVEVETGHSDDVAERLAAELETSIRFYGSRITPTPPRSVVESPRRPRADRRRRTPLRRRRWGATT